jgi:hypothetical protein
VDKNDEKNNDEEIQELEAEVLEEIEAEAAEYNDAPEVIEPKAIAKLYTQINLDGTLKKVITAKKTEFIRSIIHLDGKPFSFEGRDYLMPIYNRPDKHLLLKTARQVEKTTSLANDLVISSVVTPYNKTLYVSPSHTQTRQFSNEKLKLAIEKSPMIAKYFQDHTVSTQVFEKGFTNGSYIFLRSAFRSADRCVVEGTRISLADGSTAKVEKLSKNALLLSTPNCSKLSKKPCRDVWSNGIKPTLRVGLRSGQEVIASSNHRWVTHLGIKHTQDLLGLWLPVPLDFFSSDLPGDSTYDLLGMFLGDGCMAQGGSANTFKSSFNNNDLGFIEFFEKTAESLGLVVERSDRALGGHLNYTSNIVSKTEIYDILRNFGVLGKVWHNRFIPECVFGSKNRAVRVFRGMFESDGWVCFSTKNRQCEVGWVSGSIQLARDVQYCLQGLGIYSTLTPKDPSGRVKSVTYNIKIRSIEHIVKFANIVGFISSRKSTVLNQLLTFATENLDPASYSLDCPAREEVNAALRDFGISDHSLWANYNISYRRNSSVNGERVSRQKVQKIYEITKDQRLLKYLSDSVIWSQVTEIAPSGDREVFDLSVEDDEVFAANGVFTHNTRGISAQTLCLDEIQDFLTSEIPVIMECTSHYPDAVVRMAGTPKSFDNPIEEYWSSTSQNEWLVKCPACGKWNFLDDRNIAPTKLYIDKTLPPGPVCKKCQKPIDVRTGVWTSFSNEKSIIGYRIPQLMVPWIVGLYDQWVKLLWKRDKYPFGQFHNEVLGLSYDSASKPVTREEVIACCSDYSLWNPARLDQKAVTTAQQLVLTAGVDWGEGNDGSERGPSGKVRNASYTVLTIGTYINQRQYKVLLIKKYVGQEIDPNFIVQDIFNICRSLGVKLIGVDWGHGWGVNNLLIRKIGPEKMVQFQHLPKLRYRMKWDPIGFRYQLLRNMMMSELFFDIKKQYLMFPKWSEFEPYAKDILSIYSEYVEYRREIKFDHRPSDPDDFFHSLLYAKLTSDIYLGRSRIYTQEEVKPGSSMLYLP